MTQDLLLAALFIAFAVSISATQILLALLVLLALLRPGAASDRGALESNGSLDGATRGDGETLWRNPLTRPFLLLTGLTILSAALSENPGRSLWIARSVLRIAVFYVALHYTRSSRHATRLWQGFLVVLVIMACYGLAQGYVCASQTSLVPGAWLDEVCRHGLRVRGPFSIYMTFGGVLLFGALFVLAFLANLPWRTVWGTIPASAVLLAALALTYARNAWLGVAAGSFGLLVTGRQAARTALVLAGFAVIVAATSPEAVILRVRSIGDLEDRTARDRLAMWRSGAAMIRDHPVLGVGPGRVSALYPEYRRPEALRARTSHLHNSAIQIAVERGLPVLAVWIWLWVTFFREGGRVLSRLGQERPRERVLVCASLCGVGGFLVAGLFEDNFGDGEVVMIAYALMALPFIVMRDLAVDRRWSESSP